MEAKKVRHQSGDNSLKHSVPWIEVCDETLSVLANYILQHCNMAEQHVAANTCQL